MNRILVRIQWNANGAYGFSTLSRSHGLTQPFFINQDVPEYLSVCPCRIVRDMDSFAELYRNGTSWRSRSPGCGRRAAASCPDGGRRSSSATGS